MRVGKKPMADQHGGAPPTERSGPSLLRAYAKVARLEYLPAEVLLICIPILLSVHGLGDVLSLVFFEAVTVFFLLYFTGFMANALSDRDVDRTYSNYKRGVAEAVDALGGGRLRMLLAVHIAIALVLSYHLFLQTSNVMVLVLVGLGIFLGVGYSVRPFNFKTRGVAHGLSLASSAFFIPLAFLVLVLSGRLDFARLLFIAGFTLAMYSLEFGNQAMDFHEDRKADLGTPSVRYSIRRTVSFALTILPIGLFLTTVSIIPISMSKFRLLHPFATEWMVIAIVSSLLCAGFLGPASGLYKIFKATAPAGRADTRSARIRRAIRDVDHPRWQASGALGVVLVCGILFSSMYFSFSVPRPVEPDVNAPPKVVILNNPDQIVNVGEDVDFKADILDDGEIDTIWWDFGDGTGLTGNRSVSHIYRKVGTYNVTVRVRDDGGVTASHWMNMTVTKLYFSKLDLKAKRFITFTRIDLDFNITNDKDLKVKDELLVKVYYQNLLVQSIGLGYELRPAKVWNKYMSFDIALDKDPIFKVVLIHDLGSEQVIVEERIVNAK